MFTGTMALFVRALRTEARLPSPHVFRLLFVGLIYLTLVSTHSMSVMFGAPGLQVFRSMAYLNFFFITLGGMSFFATAITEEKEEETLGLLKMAGISPVGILLGKSTSRLIAAILLLLVQVPFTLLAITLGGVTMGQIAAAYWSLFAYLVCVANLGLLCSVMCKRAGNASGLTAILLLGFFIGTPLARWTLSGLTGTGDLAPDGFIATSVGAVLSWLSDASVFNHLGGVMMTGFRDSALSFQVVSNLGAGLAFFGIAWATFDYFTREMHSAAPARGLLFRRTSKLQSLGTRRAWANPLIWKDFHFLAGGKMMLIAKFVLYGLVVAAVAYALSTQNNFIFSLDWNQLGGWTIGLMITFTAAELSLYASRIFHEEIKWRTLSTLMMLPQSTASIVWSKVAGCVLALFPAVFYFVLGCLASPKAFSNVLEGLAEGGVWVGILVFIVFLHMTALLSLFVKWGALVLAIALLFASYMFCITPIALFSFYVRGPGPDKDVILVGFLLFLSVIIVAMQFAIGERLRIVAAK